LLERHLGLQLVAGAEQPDRAARSPFCSYRRPSGGASWGVLDKHVFDLLAWVLLDVTSISSNGY
jgi:hypothetical protein